MFLGTYSPRMDAKGRIIDMSVRIFRIIPDIDAAQLYFPVFHRSFHNGVRKCGFHLFRK